MDITKAKTVKNPVVGSPNAEKSDFQKKMEAQLGEWSARIDTLKAKAEKAGAEAKLELHKTVDELKKQEEVAKKHLDELTAASADAWKSMKNVIEDKWNELAAKVELTWSKIKA